MGRPAEQFIDRGAPASIVAEKFGGLSNLAKAIKKAPSTVHRWLVRGFIDGRYHAEILEASVRCKAGVKPLDFVDTRKPPVLAPATDAAAA